MTKNLFGLLIFYVSACGGGDREIRLDSSRADYCVTYSNGEASIEANYRCVGGSSCTEVKSVSCEATIDGGQIIIDSEAAFLDLDRESCTLDCVDIKADCGSVFVPANEAELYFDVHQKSVEVQDGATRCVLDESSNIN